MRPNQATDSAQEIELSAVPLRLRTVIEQANLLGDDFRYERLPGDEYAIHRQRNQERTEVGRLGEWVGGALLLNRHIVPASGKLDDPNFGASSEQRVAALYGKRIVRSCARKARGMTPNGAPVTRGVRVEVALGGSRRTVPGGDDLERNSNPLVRGALDVGRLAQTVMSEQRAYLEGHGVQTQITATRKNYSVFELNARAGQIGQRVSSYGRDIRPTDILYSMGDFFGSMLGYPFNEKTGTLHSDTEKFMRRSKLQLNPEYTQPTFVDPTTNQITRMGYEHTSLLASQKGIQPTGQRVRAFMSTLGSVGPEGQAFVAGSALPELGYAGRLTPLRTVLPADVTADELKALRGLENQVRPVANRQLELLPNGRLSTPMGWGQQGALRNIRIEEEKNREGVARQVLYADQVQLNRPGQDTAAKWIGSKALLTESQGGLAMAIVDAQGRVTGQINPQMVFGKAASPQLMAMQYFAGMERGSWSPPCAKGARIRAGRNRSTPWPRAAPCG